ncbi:MAG: hypothetical protein O3A93_09815 [Chloroflexi bacterium]|nr:hypothetical protein [Chloroflexota bacterium]MDA1271538.1 hypothetical protein [Chloroflexota bacterium]
MTDLIRRGLSVALITAVFLTFLGPAMDHHFAERQHTHTHVYLTGEAASQGHPGLHPFELSHSHSAFPGDAAGLDGILYQTSDDGAGNLGTLTVAPAIMGGFNHSLYGGDYLSLAIPPSEGGLPEAFVTPPTRPPRA